MDLCLLSKKYIVRRLTWHDLDLIYELSCTNTIFYKYHPPFVTRKSIKEDMEAVPPQKSLEDKYYIGFFDGNTLLAYMDLILSYPEEKVAYIGLFMTHTSYQNKGIGSHIIKDLCSYLKALDYKKVRLGVDKGNPQSYAFWIKNQFHVVEEKNYLVMETVL